MSKIKNRKVNKEEKFHPLKDDIDRYDLLLTFQRKWRVQKYNENTD